MAAIEVRNVTFEIGDDIPRDWHRGGTAITAFFDNLSLFFPAGEAFFIAAVKAHRRVVNDPELLEQVRAFCAQEGVHRREHARYNDMIARSGAPAVAMQNRVERLLRRASRLLPRRTQLSVTCALEHFTALMAHLLLSDPRVLGDADPVMASLWKWHAAEENEHKAVAFDVYREAGAPYAERAGVMLAATVIFWAKVFEHQLRLAHARGILWSLREWRSLGRFMFVEPGWAVALAPMYLAYFRPGFHPWDLDNSELLERWQQEFAQQTYLNPRSIDQTRASPA